jgi:hypothetical protein
VVGSEGGRERVSGVGVSGDGVREGVSGDGVWEGVSAEEGMREEGLSEGEKE